MVLYPCAADGGCDFSCIFQTQFFLYPSPALMVLAVSRIHRSLQHYVSLPAGDRYSTLHSILFHTHSSLCPLSAPNTNGLQNTQSSRLVARNKGTSVIHRLEVTVQRDTAHEEYPMSQMNHCGSYPASDEPHKIGADDDV